jgi:phosphopantothenoylcysteine decarboxylase
MTTSQPKILLGLTGSVACIKTEPLFQAMSAIGQVKMIASECALPFLEEETKKNLIRDQDEWKHWQKIGDPVVHIELRKWADIYVIAPLSANTLAKLSNGISDNLLTSVARAWDFSKPIVIAPAMNTHMWEHPITQEQIKKVRDWGYRMIPPVTKKLACADTGIGAMEEVPLIVKYIQSFLPSAQPA